MRHALFRYLSFTVLCCTTMQGAAPTFLQEIADQLPHGFNAPGIYVKTDQVAPGNVPLLQKMRGGGKVKLMKQNDTAPKEAYKNVEWVIPTPQGGIFISERNPVDQKVQVNFCKEYQLSDGELIVQTKDQAFVFASPAQLHFENFQSPLPVFSQHGDVFFFMSFDLVSDKSKILRMAHLTYDKGQKKYKYTNGVTTMPMPEKISHMAVSDNKKIFIVMKDILKLEPEKDRIPEKISSNVSKTFKDNLLSVKFQDGDDTKPLEFCTRGKKGKNTTFSFYYFAWDELDTKLETPGDPHHSYSYDLSAIKDIKKISSAPMEEKGFFWDTCTLSYQDNNDLFKEETVSNHHVAKEAGLVVVIAGMGVVVYTQFFNAEAIESEDEEASVRKSRKKRKEAAKLKGGRTMPKGRERRPPVKRNVHAQGMLLERSKKRNEKHLRSQKTR